MVLRQLRPGMELFQCGICQMKFSFICDFYQHFQEHRTLLCSSFTDTCKTAAKNTQNGNSCGIKDIKTQFLSRHIRNLSDSDEHVSTDLNELMHIFHCSENKTNEVDMRKDTDVFPNFLQGSFVRCAACKEEFPTICAVRAHLKNKSFYFSEITQTCIPQTLSCHLSADSDFFISVELRKTSESENGTAVVANDTKSVDLFDIYNVLNQDIRSVQFSNRPDFEELACESVCTYIKDTHCKADNEIGTGGSQLKKAAFKKDSKNLDALLDFTSNEISCDKCSKDSEAVTSSRSDASFTLAIQECVSGSLLRSGTVELDTNSTAICNEIQRNNKVNRAVSLDQHDNSVDGNVASESGDIYTQANECHGADTLGEISAAPQATTAANTSDNLQASVTEECNSQLQRCKVIKRKRGRPPKNHSAKSDYLGINFSSASGDIVGKAAVDVKLSVSKLPVEESNSTCLENRGACNEIKLEPFDKRHIGNVVTAVSGKKIRGRPRKPESELKQPRKTKPGCAAVSARPKVDKKARTECHNCGRMFIGYCLKNHIKACTMDRQFTCDLCGRRFATKGALVSHKKCVHLKANSYQCEVCGASFFVPSKLAKHMRNHTDERSYACAVCNKTFKHEEYLRKHEKIHTGIKDQVCSTCGKMFYSQWNLTQHELTHRDIRAFRCGQCGRTFTTKRSLKNHQKQTICHALNNYVPENITPSTPCCQHQ